MSSQLTQSAKLVGIAISTGMLCACITVSAGGDPDYQKPDLPDYQKPDLNETTQSSFDETTSKTPQGPGPLEDQTLILDAEDIIDEDGIGHLNFQWQVQTATGRWVMADKGTAQAFTPRQKHVGKLLRAKIEYLDGQGTSETIITPSTAPVQNVNDLPVGHITLLGSTKEDQTLQIDASTLNDEDGLGLFTYSWERSFDGVNWSFIQTNNSDPSLLKLKQAQVGYSFRGSVNYVDGHGTVEELVSSSSGLIQNIDDPAVGSVTIIGPLFKGSKLSVDTSKISDEDGIASVTATWQISNDGATWQSAFEVKNREFSLTQAHLGKVIRVRAVVVDNFGNQAEIYSSVTTPVENVNSKPEGLVRIISAE